MPPLSYALHFDAHRKPFTQWLSGEKLKSLLEAI